LLASRNSFTRFSASFNVFFIYIIPNKFTITQSQIASIKSEWSLKETIKTTSSTGKPKNQPMQKTGYKQSHTITQVIL